MQHNPQNSTSPVGLMFMSSSIVIKLKEASAFKFLRHSSKIRHKTTTVSWSVFIHWRQGRERFVTPCSLVSIPHLSRPGEKPGKMSTNDILYSQHARCILGFLIQLLNKIPYYQSVWDSSKLGCRGMWNGSSLKPCSRQRWYTGQSQRSDALPGFCASLRQFIELEGRMWNTDQYRTNEL